MRSPSHPRVLPSHQHEPRDRPLLGHPQFPPSLSPINILVRHENRENKIPNGLLPKIENDRSLVCCSEDTCSTRMCTSAKIFPTEAGQSQEEEEENAENFLGHGKNEKCCKERERKRVHYFGANLVYCAAAATTLNHEDDYITGRGACFRIYACGVQASGHGACVFVWSLDL